MEDLKHISDANWYDIIKTMFWDKWRADDIHSQKVANILVDWALASGIHGIKKPQALLGVVADGIVVGTEFDDLGILLLGEES